MKQLTFYVRQWDGQDRFLSKCESFLFKALKVHGQFPGYPDFHSVFFLFIFYGKYFKFISFTYI